MKEFSTELGHEWAQGNDPSPEDQQGFLSALRAQVPQIDPIIDQYVQEAVAAFARNMFFASAVMVGAASEKTIYLLMDALAGAVSSQTERTAVLKAVNERGITSMLKFLQHNLSLAKKPRLGAFMREQIRPFYHYLKLSACNEMRRFIPEREK